MRGSSRTPNAVSDRSRRSFLRDALATTTLLGLSSPCWQKAWGADSAPLGLSLHCGLNALEEKYYNGAQPLRGCHNDALDMKQIAVKGGYHDPKVLLDDQATANEVRRHISWAIKHLRPGDTFFISASSHGTQIYNPETNEPDKTDEAWCLFDHVLLDDEFNALFKQFRPGVKVLVVLDMCHSGTSEEAINLRRAAARKEWDLPDLKLPKPQGAPTDRQLRAAQRLIGKNLSAKRLPEEVASEISERDSRQFVSRQKVAEQRSSTREAIQPSGLMITGSLDLETALDGERNGLFTEGLVRAWQTGRFTSYSDLFFKGVLRELEGMAQTPIIYPFGGDFRAWRDARPFEVS
jgi:metacaspase-1